MSARPSYTLVDTPAAFRDAAGALALGRGPFAVDTERASSFRYGDRAFLVQVRRRGAGTFLIAPEGHRDAAMHAFAPVLNGADWIIHAAGEDLRSLAHLGLHPGSLFDTELASRLAGFDRPNLAAMVERFVGVELEKGHGHEDWSRTPLPTAWQDYAALDVEYLNELAEALTEYLDIQGKLDWATQEFNHLIAAYSLTPRPQKTWRDVKGVSTLRDASGLQVARELWQARERLGQERDISPGRLLPNRDLVDIARTKPSSARELSRTIGRASVSPRDSRRWLTVVEQALAADPSSWPQRHAPQTDSVPSKSGWERHYPRSWEMLQVCRERIAERATALGMQPEILLAPSNLRAAVWQAPEAAPAWDTHHAADALQTSGARAWQIGFTAPILAAAHSEVVAPTTGRRRC